MPGLGGKIALLIFKAEAQECVLLCLAGCGLRWGSLARSREVTRCVGNAKTEALPPRALGQLNGTLPGNATAAALDQSHLHQDQR